MTKSRSGWPLFWHVVGLAFSVVLVTAGLLTIGFYVFLAIGINAWASNK
jgi:hypothetical protein